MADTQSVLDQMTAGIVGRKAAKSAGLTPTPGEVAASSSAVPARIAASFPNDHPREAIEQAIGLIRLEVAHVLSALDAIESVLGTVRAPSPAPVADVKAQEREADERAAEYAAQQKAEFAASIAQKAREAQESVFGPTPDAGWKCPKHGDAKITNETSRRGRKYRKCGLCTEFEKGTE